MQPLRSLFRCALLPLVITFALFGCADSSSSQDPTDATLTSLTVRGADLEPTFEPTRTDYSVNAAYSTASITIEPVATNSAATIRIGDVIIRDHNRVQTIKPPEGETVVTVKVTSEDEETTKEYKLTISRETEEEFAQKAYLKATNAGSGGEFGNSVAIDGDTFVVGADQEDSSAPADPSDDTAEDSGTAYVFTRTGSSWSQQAYLKASNLGGGEGGDFGDSFGRDVAIYDDGTTLTLVAGATREDSSTDDNGADNNVPGQARFPWPAT